MVTFLSLFLFCSQSLPGPQPFQEPLLDQNQLVMEGPEGQGDGGSSALLPRKQWMSKPH